MQTETSSVKKRVPALGASAVIAFAMLISRITGLLRETVVAHFFGASYVADAFRGAFRIPNMLNNLFGEGVLSASFITVYARLRALGKDDEARQVSAVVFGTLALLCSLLVFAGILLAPFLTDVIVPGFQGRERALTVQIIRILFPGTGFLVLGAWCLGVLNSHRSFLLPYVAPVAANLIMVAALFAFHRGASQEELILKLSWAFVLGSAAQFLIQVPKVLRLLPRFRPSLRINSPDGRTVINNFVPIFLSRGVVQISAYVDQMIASWLPQGAVAQLGYGQVISLLPISLFSMSVSAAELPALSSATGTAEEVASTLRNRLSNGLRRIAFFTIPSAVAFLLLGDVIAGAIYQSGRFTHTDSLYVWAVLAGSSIGLLASSLGRLYSSGFYALLDSRTPLRFAIIRIALTTCLGFLFALELPKWLGIDPQLGVAGLTASAGIAGWVEFVLLRRALNGRIGKTGIPAEFLVRLWPSAFVSGAVAYFSKSYFAPGHPRIQAALVLPLFGLLYFGGTHLLGVEEAKHLTGRVLRQLRRG
ncbi:MAG: murein biosynthesis integral membrane protein MurJ [Bryobacteraceae bacterium]